MWRFSIPATGVGDIISTVRTNFHLMGDEILWEEETIRKVLARWFSLPLGFLPVVFLKLLTFFPNLVLFLSVDGGQLLLWLSRWSWSPRCFTSRWSSTISCCCLSIISINSLMSSSKAGCPIRTYWDSKGRVEILLSRLVFAVLCIHNF